jgi:acetolactate synthase-1/2/3 large subunit
VVFLVVNDERFGAIHWLQERFFGRAGEADLTNPDFPALARAFGCHAERVDAAGLGAALGRALAADRPTVLELPAAVDPPWEF